MVYTTFAYSFYPYCTPEIVSELLMWTMQETNLATQWQCLYAVLFIFNFKTRGQSTAFQSFLVQPLFPLLQGSCLMDSTNKSCRHKKVK